METEARKGVWKQEQQAGSERDRTGGRKKNEQEGQQIGVTEKEQGTEELEEDRRRKEGVKTGGIAGGKETKNKEWES